MYRYQDRVKENAMYWDTDSVVYIQPRYGPQLIQKVDNLGDMIS